MSSPFKSDYTTLATVKDYLKITGTGDDTQLSRLITAVSDYIDHYCDVPGFAAVNGATLLLDGSGTNELQIPFGVRALTLLEVRQVPTYAYTTVASTNYYFNPVDGVQMNFPYTHLTFTPYPDGTVVGFYRGPRAVRLTGDFGYETIPSAVQEACIEIVAGLHKRRLAGPTDTLGDNSQPGAGFGRFMPAFVKAALEAYKHSGGVTIAGTGPGLRAGGYVQWRD